MFRKLATCSLLLGLAACNAKVTTGEDDTLRDPVSVEKKLSIGEADYETNSIELDSSVSRGARVTWNFRSVKTGRVRVLMGFAAGINCDLSTIAMKSRLDEDFTEGEPRDLPVTLPVTAHTDYKLRLLIPENSCEALSFAIEAKYLADGETTP
jgi:hypothetical protein